jgi:hypothetical protein
MEEGMMRTDVTFEGTALPLTGVQRSQKHAVTTIMMSRTEPRRVNRWEHNWSLFHRRLKPLFAILESILLAAILLRNAGRS